MLIGQTQSGKENSLWLWSNREKTLEYLTRDTVEPDFNPASFVWLFMTMTIYLLGERCHITLFPLKETIKVVIQEI